MNKLILFSIFIFCFAIALHNCNAQDTLVKKDNEIIRVKIIEVGTTEVKYKYIDAPDGPISIISKDDIKTLKIKGQDDKMMTIITAPAPVPDPSPQPDIIIKKNGEQIKANIVEVGPTQIKYRYFDSPNGPLIVMERRDIKTIKVKGNGKGYDVIENKPDPMSVSNSIISDKTSALKFNFFSPLSHHLAFSYEWMVKPGFNWEMGMGIVGPGVGIADNLENTHPKGFFLRTGPKFLLGNSSDIEIEGARYAHPLKGRYFKIETILYTLSKNYVDTYVSSTYYNYGATPTNVSTNYMGVALDVIYGRQFICGNSITVGYYIGFGYGFENKQTTYNPVIPTGVYTYSDYDPSRYSHTYLGRTFPLIITGGFNIGYIFKTPEWINRITAPRVSNKAPSRHSLDND